MTTLALIAELQETKKQLSTVTAERDALAAKIEALKDDLAEITGHRWSSHEALVHRLSELQLEIESQADSFRAARDARVRRDFLESIRASVRDYLNGGGGDIEIMSAIDTICTRIKRETLATYADSLMDRTQHAGASAYAVARNTERAEIIIELRRMAGEVKGCGKHKNPTNH